MSIPDLCRMTVPPLRRLLAEPLKHAKQIMFLEDHELWYSARRNWARLVLFRRSLNLKLILFVYLTLMQLVVCLDRHAQIITKFPFTVQEASDDHRAELATKIVFSEQIFLDSWFILLDVIRLAMLCALFFWPRFVGFPFFAIILFSFANLYEASLEIWNPKQYHFIYNLKYNPIFRLSLLNEVMVRLAVIYLWKQRNSDFLSGRKTSFNWKFSTADLFVLVALTAMSAAIVR